MPTLLSTGRSRCFSSEEKQLKATAIVKSRLSLSVQHHGQNGECAQWMNEHRGCALFLRVKALPICT